MNGFMQVFLNVMRQKLDYNLVSACHLNDVSKIWNSINKVYNIKNTPKRVDQIT